MGIELKISLRVGPLNLVFIRTKIYSPVSQNLELLRERAAMFDIRTSKISFYFWLYRRLNLFNKMLHYYQQIYLRFVLFQKIWRIQSYIVICSCSSVFPVSLFGRWSCNVCDMGGRLDILRWILFLFCNYDHYWFRRFGS